MRSPYSTFAEKHVAVVPEELRRASAPAAPASPCRTPAPALAPDRTAANCGTPPPASAWPAPGADALGCTRAGTRRRPAAARAGWPGAARPSPPASVRCMRSCRPFCSGWPAAMRRGTMPSLIHQTASRDNPATAQEANGGPLSVRIADGMPYSRNAASKMACTRSVSLFSTAWQRSR